MNAPFSLREGSILLLAEPGSFSALYIRRSLEMFGVPFLAPAGPPDRALAALDPAEWLSISACIAVDIGAGMFEALSAMRSIVPCMFVGSDPGRFLGHHNWLCPPFAAFQVVDRLAEMVAPVGFTLRRGMEAAATPR